MPGPILLETTTPGMYVAAKANSAGNMVVITTPSIKNSATFFPASSYSSTQISGDIDTGGMDNMQVMLNLTVVPGVDTVQLIIDAKDASTGTYDPIANITATAVTGYFTLQAGIGINSATNKFNTLLPTRCRVRVVHSGAGAFTYSCSYFGK